MRVRAKSVTFASGQRICNRLSALDVETVERCCAWFRDFAYSTRNAATVLQRDDVRPEISLPQVEGLRDALGEGLEHIVPAVYKAFGDAGSAFLDRICELLDAVGELIQAIDGGCRDLLGSEATERCADALGDARPLFRDLIVAFNNAIVPATDAEPADGSAFVPAGKLDWQSKPGLITYKRLRAFLKRYPQIRTCPLGGRRFGIHAGDWAKYWAAKDGSAFEALATQAENVETMLEGAAARKASIPKKPNRRTRGLAEK